MKGFGIEIKNTLLDPKHIQAMGPAVWLYMWLIDKVTSIDEDQIGKVLGGKPVKFEEVEAELGISQDTYTRWIARLVEYPYISAVRTPYGIVFRVFKIHKRFGNRIRKNAESGKPVDNKGDSAGMPERFRENADSTSAIVRNVIRQNSKTEQDNTSQPAKPAASGVDKKQPSAHKQFMVFWYDTVKRARGIKPIISGADARNLKRVLDSGVDESVLEQLALYFLADYSFKKFSPTISTFCSAGIINGLLNRTKNDPEFRKNLDRYAGQYISIAEVVGIKELQVGLRNLAEHFVMPGVVKNH